MQASVTWLSRRLVNALLWRKQGEEREDDMLVRVDMLLHQSVFLRNIPVLSKSNRTGDALAVSTTVGRCYSD